jgi:hypothetical protein
MGFILEAAYTPGCARLSDLRLDPGGTAAVCEVFQISSTADVVFASVEMATGLLGTLGNWRVP